MPRFLCNPIAVAAAALLLAINVAVADQVASPPKAGVADDKPAATDRDAASTPSDLVKKVLKDLPAAAVETPQDAAANRRDPMRRIQSDAVKKQISSTAHWGRQTDKFVSWSKHSNRLVPVYSFGITLDSWRDRGSPYADRQRLQKLYSEMPERSYNPVAIYYDQTDVYRLQQTAVEMGCSAIIMMVFDGMDWPTTRMAAIYNDPRLAKQSKDWPYRSGRGSGLSIMDYRGCPTDFGLVVTSAHSGGATYDVDGQVIIEAKPSTGGYDVVRGGEWPWIENSQQDYLIGRDREVKHQVTDSAASATSLFSGIKTYNGSINVAVDGSHAEPIARQLQNDGWKIGVVTSVPVSHATPAAAYANNVTRKDYQDIARDLIGLPSSSHRDEPLPGVDVLIGGGYGEGVGEEKLQGRNFAAGNPYIHQDDVAAVTSSKSNGDDQDFGRYVFATRQADTDGGEALMRAAEEAVEMDARLLGLFGVKGGHLPFRTADGNYDPTFDIKGAERYDADDILENPTLAEMTAAALRVLENSIEGFWLLVEAGDVDWANHANNLDNSVGAVISGDEAFSVVTDWVERNRAWDYTAVIVTADHGHFLVIDDDLAIAKAGEDAAKRVSKP